MPRVSPLLLAPPLVFAALAAVFYIGMQREDPDALPSALAGRPAPEMALTPLGEAPLLTDAALRAGEVTLVNYWASWCAPCRAEHAFLEDLSDEGVTIHGINYKDEPDNALSFLAELGNPYDRLGADARGRTALDWGLYGVPETYVVAGDGTIVLRFAGPLTAQVVERRIRPAIAEAEALAQ